MRGSAPSPGSHPRHRPEDDHVESGPWKNASRGAILEPMCNLYTQTTAREAARRLFKVEPAFDLLGNHPIENEGSVYPDKDAPVVRTRRDGARELLMMRWGFPPAEEKGRPVTNVRNLSSPYWRGWLDKPAFRCLVPAERFAEPHPTRKDAKGWVDNEWFGMANGEPFAFAGIWRPWTGPRSIGNRKEGREGVAPLRHPHVCAE